MYTMIMKKAPFCLIILAFLAATTLTPRAAEGAARNWKEAAGKIAAVLERALSTYEKGEADDAMEMVADAYFGIFEGADANMEIAVRRYLSLSAAITLEKSFNSIRRAMYESKPQDQISRDTKELIKALSEAARQLDEKEVGMDMSY